MEGDNDGEVDNSDTKEVTNDESATTIMDERVPIISLNALNGCTTFDCMRVTGQCGKRKLHILINPGSTLNFLDLNMANELGLALESIKPMSVSAVTGGALLTKYKCREFTWRMQEYTLTTEVRLLPLDCCDYVLGVQWLSTLGPILWDFSNLRMKFTLNTIKHVLRGVTKCGCKLISGGSLNKLLMTDLRIIIVNDQQITEDMNFCWEPEMLFSHIATSGDAMNTDPSLLQLCVDYRGVNKQTVKDKYLIPLLEDLLDELGGGMYFSKLDLRAGFHQLRMSPVDVYKTAETPHTWSNCLPLAEWWYNTTFHSAINTTPFEALNGQPPPLHLPYLPGESSCAAADKTLQSRENVIRMLKFYLERAQNRMRQFANAHRSHRELQLSIFVYLKLQPYRQHSMKNQKNPHKLAPKYYGFFRIVDKVGAVPYKLDLPPSAAIHDVFHVSQLNLCPNPLSVPGTLPQYLLDLGNAKEPKAILDKKMVKHRNMAATKVLVQWKGYPPEKAMWEFYKDVTAAYPNFDS